MHRSSEVGECAVRRQRARGGREKAEAPGSALRLACLPLASEVLRARERIELNVAPLLAVEAMTLALRTG